MRFNILFCKKKKEASCHTVCFQGGHRIVKGQTPTHDQKVRDLQTWGYLMVDPRDFRPF